MYYFLKVKEQFISLHLIYIKHFMANNYLLNYWINEVHWGYNYLLVVILLLVISILLYRIRKLQKTIKKTNHSYRFSFDILDNLPFPIFVKDITNDFRYYYWNKESAAQSGISSEEAIGHTDYEIYGEERGEKYRHIDKELIQAGKVYRKEEKYTTPDGITHDTIAVKSMKTNIYRPDAKLYKLIVCIIIWSLQTFVFAYQWINYYSFTVVIQGLGTKFYFKGHRDRKSTRLNSSHH